MAYQYTQVYVARDLNTQNSVVTSAPFFMADFSQVNVSVSTQSNAAINRQESNADGLSSPIPENSWANVQPISVNSTFNITVSARWSRISTPALSNSTIIFVGTSR